VRRGLLALPLLVAIAAGCGTTETVTTTVTVTTSAAEKAGVGAPGETVEYGTIHSLLKQGDHYVLRFDPAWLLTGATASTAAAEDGAVPPGQPVPNDNYVVDEGHRLLTYLVPADARVTVLKDGVGGSPITVAQLAELVGGRNPFPKPLFEPLSTGVWLRARIDTVRSLDQQYKP